jgi:hypothetical protein
LLVIDLPLNRGVLNPDGTMTGLGFTNNLKVADFLAFEFNTILDMTEQNEPVVILDGDLYQLLGVEFFETTTAMPSFGVTIWDSLENAGCEPVGQE